MPEPNARLLSVSLARPELAAISPTVHGALDFEELERLRISPDDILDFSVNSNPFGPAPSVKEAVDRVPLERYPDRESLALRRALGLRLGVAPEQIMVGNGTSELIQLIALAFLSPGDSVLVLAPTFGEYTRAACMMGADVDTWVANPQTDFAFDIETITRQLQTPVRRLVFLCNPNNPTGQCLPSGALAAWARADPQTLFVVDEAYIAFAPEVESAVQICARNVLVLRSMTKDYALAGLRLGYAMGNQEVIEVLSRVRPPWNVNALAQAAGLGALQDEAYLQEALSKLEQEKQFLLAGLQSLGFSPVLSSTHFFLLAVGHGASFRRALLPKGILVRDCASFGLPGYVRISPRLHPENIRLLELIRSECQS